MRRFASVIVLVAPSVIALGPTAAAAQSAPAAATLRGRVIDARTTVGIPAVAVAITNGGDTLGRAQTDTAGGFAITVSPLSPAFVHFTRAGYRTDSTAVNFVALNPLRVAMTPLTIVASAGGASRAGQAADFERRARRHAGGVFVTEAEIENRRPVRTSDLFRGMVGITVRDSLGILQLVSNRGIQVSLAPTTTTTNVAQGSTSPTGTASGGRGTLPSTLPSNSASSGISGTGNNCSLRVAVDGLVMNSPFSVDDIPVSVISGIEAYVGAASIPVEFLNTQQDTPCGIVLIWTRNQPPRAP